jgi:WD40 repeat protein
MDRLQRDNKWWTVLLLLLLLGPRCAGARLDGPPEVLDCSEDLAQVAQGTPEPVGQERIAFIDGRTLHMMDPDGGNLTTVAEGVASFEPAPDNRHLIYHIYEGPSFVYDVRIQETQKLRVKGNALTWSPDGNCLVFGTANIVGNPRQELKLYHLSDGRVEKWDHIEPLSLIEISPDGKYFAAGCPRAFNLCITAVDGGETHRFDRKDAVWSLEWSPDSRYILYYDSKLSGNRGAPDTLYYVDRDADWTRSVLLQFDPTDPQDPSYYGFGRFEWSPDGTRIVTELGSGLSMKMIAVIDFPQGTYRVLDLSSLYMARWPSWGPDGQRIVFVGTSPDSNVDIYVVNTDGTGLTLLRQSESKSKYVTNPTWLVIP